MDNCEVRITLKEGAKVPTYGSSQAAGADLCAHLQNSVTIQPHKFMMIPTGVSIQLPIGYEAQIRPRSGLAAKKGITVLNTPGTIDSDYRGEVCVVLINHSDEAFTIENGDRIAQMVIAKHETASFEICQSLDSTDRGQAGFGSTGIKG